MSTLEPPVEHVVVPHEERLFNFERLFVSDLRREGVIPGALLVYPELAALEVERARLAAALDEAEQGGGGGYLTGEQYVAARAAALREGRDLPPAPPTAAEVAAESENRRRNVPAAEDALLALGETLRHTVAAHAFEWGKAASEKVKALRDEAAERMRQAREAEGRAQEAEHYERWLRRCADGELYYPTFTLHQQPQDEPDLVWNITDPQILDLIAASRSGQAL